MTAQQVKKADDEAAKKAPPPTPKTTEKTAQTGAGAKTDLKAAKPSRDGAKTTAVAKAKTPATKKAEKAPAKAKAPAKPRAQIGRAHVCTPVTNAHLVCRLLLAKKTK